MYTSTEPRLTNYEQQPQFCPIEGARPEAQGQCGMKKKQRGHVSDWIGSEEENIESIGGKLPPCVGRLCWRSLARDADRGSCGRAGYSNQEYGQD